MKKVVNLAHYKRAALYGLRFLLIFLISSCSLTNTENNPCAEYPKSIGFVSDFEHVFSIEQIDSLSNSLMVYETQTTNEIAVVTTKSIASDSTLFDYSLNLAQCWGVGKKEKGNGVVIVFSNTLRQIHIQNGTGITDKLTDAEAKQIIDSIITPSFKQANYYAGIHNGILAIMKELE